jgi:hypothetical protein
MADSPNVTDARKALGRQLALHRQAAGYNQHELAPLVHYGRSTIANVEVGRQNVPRAFWSRCDELLQADGALLAGYERLEAAKRARHRTDAGEIAATSPEVSAGRVLAANLLPLASDAPDGAGADHGAEDDRVDRRSFLGVSAGVAAASVLPAPPVVVRASDIHDLREAARLFGSLDHTYGGGTVRAAVTSQLRWAGELLKSDCPASLRPDLFAAVGFLSSVCGFMAFDAYAHDDARRMLRFGLVCAEEAGDWHLRAKLLSHLARQAIWCGDPDTGLTQAELALVRSDRLGGTERAMLHSARARALAKLGQVQATLDAVGAADEAFAAATPETDPPWMAYYGAAQHQGDTGHALFDLGMSGYRPEQAASRLVAAVQAHTDAYARSRAISGTKLASLTMTCGDPQEAVAIGSRALDDAGRVRSRRAADDLRELDSLAAVHAGRADVVDLRQRNAGGVAAQ